MINYKAQLNKTIQIICIILLTTIEITLINNTNHAHNNIDNYDSNNNHHHHFHLYQDNNNINKCKFNDWILDTLEILIPSTYYCCSSSAENICGSFYSLAKL